VRTTLVFLSLLLLVFQSQGQFHRADSLFKSYSHSLKKKGIDTSLVVSQGRFNNNEYEPRTLITRVDSLKIISLAVVEGIVELAVFDDYNTPVITKLVDCTLFQKIDSLRNSLVTYKQYLKIMSANKGAIKPVIQQFETIFINLKKDVYTYRIAEKTKDYLGNKGDSQPGYFESRQVVDAVYALVPGRINKMGNSLK
jgi:hypothetical protein